MGPTVLGSNKNKQTNTYLTFSKKKKKKKLLLLTYVELPKKVDRL